MFNMICLAYKTAVGSTHATANSVYEWFPEKSTEGRMVTPNAVLILSNNDETAGTTDQTYNVYGVRSTLTQTLTMFKALRNAIKNSTPYVVLSATCASEVSGAPADTIVCTLVVRGAIDCS